MLRRLHKDYPADYSACVFDAKGKTFRDELYPEYKAHRPPMPDDLAAQIEPLHETIAAMGWPLLMVEGVEADDVIGTLARQAEREGMRRGDLHRRQGHHAAREPRRHAGQHHVERNAGRSRRREKVRRAGPSASIDYLTLIGDSVDNVPGVDKVGPKTAVKWLTQYGTLDNVVAHAGEIGGVVGENLRKALGWLPQARELLTIKCDVELPAKVEELAPQAPGQGAACRTV